MNIFSRVLKKHFDPTRRLGNPLSDPGLRHARMNYMATLMRSNGFQIPALEPEKDAQGLTRGQRKRIARAAANRKEFDRQKAEADAIVKRRRCKKSAVYFRYGCLAGLA